MTPFVRPLVTYGISVLIVEYIECFKLGRVLRNWWETLRYVKSVWKGTLTNSALLQHFNGMREVLLLSELCNILQKGRARYASEGILDTSLRVIVEVELGLDVVNGLLRSLFRVHSRHCRGGY